MDKNGSDNGLGMHLCKVIIRNFRGIRDLTVDLDRVTVIIGENNTGKTAFLEAIRICLNRLRSRSWRFNEFDYYLANESSTSLDADSINIELLFQEIEGNALKEETAQDLISAMYFKNGKYNIHLRVVSGYNDYKMEYETKWMFLNGDGTEMERLTNAQPALTNIQSYFPTSYLSALRDAEKQFGQRSQYWREFLKEEAIEPSVRQMFEKEFAEINSKIVASHEPLAEVRSRLESSKEVIEFGAGDTVAIDALPPRLSAALARAQVSFANQTRAKIPLEWQGQGTQSLAVLLLFDAFLRSQSRQRQRDASAITALEEPEAHLHPCAIRSLMKIVQNTPSQVILSTHSGEVAAYVNVMSIRRFAFKHGQVRTFRISQSTYESSAFHKLDYHLRQTRGELLFARCWLLVEGETERIVIHGVADVSEIDLERAGVRCVEYSQSNLGMLLSVANDLGISWVCVADGDTGGKEYEEIANQHIETADEGMCTVLPYRNIEHLLCKSGFGHLYQAKSRIKKLDESSDDPTEKNWDEVLDNLPTRFSKPGAALDAVQEMRENGSRPPDEIVRILGNVVSIARS